MIGLFNYILPLFYFSLVWTYGKAFFADKPWAKHAKTPILICTILVHLLALALRTIVFRHPPVTTIFEIFTVLACSISITYFIIELRSQRKETGYFYQEHVGSSGNPPQHSFWNSREFCTPRVRRYHYCWCVQFHVSDAVP